MPTSRLAGYRSKNGSPLAVTLIVVGFALIHSLLASRAVKNTVARVAGRRTRNGLYRSGFIVQSVVTTIWAIRSFLRLPDRTLYRVPLPFAWMLYAVQIASFALLVSAINVTGLRRIIGLPQLASFLRGEEPPAEAEAQGPPPAANSEKMDVRGPFRFIRHPDNLPIITLLWSFPKMTVNRLTLAVLSFIYAVLGSWHEDTRLRARYGNAFEVYARKTPMLVPGLIRGRQLE